MKPENSKPMPAPAPAAPEVAPTHQNAVPDWVTETPDMEYNLIMFDCDGSGRQSIDLTREEFIKLKEYLAELRGLPLPAEESAA